MIERQLLESTALIFIFAFAVALIRAKYLSRLRKLNDVVIGLTYAAITVFGMNSPLIIAEGVRYDARSAFIGVVAMCYGGRVAAYAVSIPIVYRLWIGGLGVVPGILSLLASAAIGSWLHLLFSKRRRNPTWLEMFGIGAIFATSALIWTALLPPEIRNLIIFENGFSIIGIHILATMIFGGLEYDNQTSIKNYQSVLERDELLRNAEKVTDLGFLFINVRSKLMTASESLREALSLEESGSISLQTFIETRVEVIDRQKALKHFSTSDTVGAEIVFRASYNSGPERIFSSRLIGTRGTRAAKESVHLLVDLSEKQALLEQASHSARLAALGETASKISHEIVNPLTAARLLNERLRSQVQKLAEPNSDVHSLIDRLENRLDSTLNLVRTISGFSRAKPEQFGPQHIHEDIFVATELFQDIGGAHSVKLTLDLTAANDLVVASPLHIQQILLNLLTNARDALKEVINPTLEIKTFNEDNCLVVEVTDNGTGVGSEIEGRIFDPFFTTKERGRGTGLGLSIVQSLIAEMRGSISYRSRKPSGSTFILRFPLTIK